MVAFMSFLVLTFMLTIDIYIGYIRDVTKEVDFKNN